MRRSSVCLRSALARRGEMSTTTIVFIVLGAVFAALVIMVIVGAALLMPAVQQARVAAQRTQSKNNLKQIGLAMHNYHDVYKGFANSIYTPDEQPYNSWMTALLPYVDQSPLYDQMDTNQPWTSAGNQAVCEYEVPAYLNPALVTRDPTATHVNGLGAAHYAGNLQLLERGVFVQLREITDGSSNTIMGGEVSSGFKPWGDPDNLRDPGIGFGDSADKFGATEGNGQIVQMLLCDGSVRVISVDLQPTVLQNLANPRDGNPIGDF